MEELISQLQSTQSPKRRSAAKALRKLGAAEAGPALLEALAKEVKDKRTWETQYQLVMALGHCKHYEALTFLEALALTTFEATIIYLALGDAIVRLSVDHSADVRKVLAFIRDGRDRMLIDGALRAMAMLRLVPEQKDMAEIIDFANKLPLDDGLRFWVAAATPGWSGAIVSKFLDDCAESSRQDVQEAVKSGRKKKYVNWNPL